MSQHDESSGPPPDAPPPPDTADEVTRAGLTESEMRANVIRLAFGGDERRLDEFCAVIREVLPPDAAAVLRGSSVTGFRWEDGAPFDADGPGTSDLDLTLVGEPVLAWYLPHGFYIPDLHSIPLSDEHPDIGPALWPLRQRLVDMVHRPVNIQGTRSWIMFVREYVMRQPYLTLIGKLEET
jgi:hypothetical protein